MSTGVVIVAAALIALISNGVMLAYLRFPNKWNLLSPVGFYWATYIPLLQIPAFFLYVYEFNEPHMWVLPIGISVVPMFVAFGAMTVQPRHFAWWMDWAARPVWATPGSLSAGRVLIAISVLLLMVITLKIGPTRIPIVNVFRVAGRPALVSDLREQFKYLPLGLNYLSVWNRRVLVPIGVGSILVVTLIRKRGYGFLLLALGLGVIATNFTLERQVAALFLLTLFFCYFLRGGRLKIRYVVIGLLLLSLFPMLIQMFRYGFDLRWARVSELYVWLLKRTFVVTCWTTGGAMNYMHKYMDGAFVHGRTIGWWCRITGQDVFALPWLLGQTMEHHMPTTLANFSYIGDAYANWGFLGIPIYSFLVGTFLGAAERVFVRIRKTAFTLACASAFLVQVVALHGSALQVYLLTYGGVLILLLAKLPNFLGWEQGGRVPSNPPKVLQQDR